MDELNQRLFELSKQGNAPFHMPGHKRDTSRFVLPNPYEIDITEIDGFDNLHEPEDVLLRAMEEATTWYQTTRSFFMVNGSTGGILAAITACTEIGDTILVARNCHKAVYHVIELRNLQPIYLYPNISEKFGIAEEISPQEVKNALEAHPEAKLLLITSPTYEGVVSDVRSIATLAHASGIPLVVDSAHGAHFHYHNTFPVPATRCGADIVIESLHKTLPALTQSAILHYIEHVEISGGGLEKRQPFVSIKRLEQALSTYQTSSPSYVLLAGITKCLCYMQQDGIADMQDYVGHLKMLYERLQGLRNLRVYKGEGTFDRDISKLVIDTKGTTITGPQLYEQLRQGFGIQPEMKLSNQVLLMTAVGDTEESYERLIQVLFTIDGQLEPVNLQVEGIKRTMMPAEVVLCPYEASRVQGVYRPLAQTEGMIALEMLTIYPPGIPILVPGERITAETIRLLQDWEANQLMIHGQQQKGMLLVECDTIDWRQL